MLWGRGAIFDTDFERTSILVVKYPTGESIGKRLSLPEPRSPQPNVSLFTTNQVEKMLRLSFFAELFHVPNYFEVICFLLRI